MTSFERTDDGEWVVWLDCGHRRHVRHRPPLSSYPWIDDDAQRLAHVGQAIECERCGQREWPAGVEPYRTTPSFDASTVPAGLLAAHNTRAGVWGRLEVEAGTLALVFAAPLDERVELHAGEWAAIPPTLEHHVELADGARFHVVFCRRPAAV
jgi:tellurite resistance-related uncharacterized protein